MYRSPNGIIPAGLVKRQSDIIGHGVIDCVELIGAVQRDRGNPVPGFVQNRFKFHCHALFHWLSRWPILSGWYSGRLEYNSPQWEARQQAVLFQSWDPNQVHRTMPLNFTHPFPPLERYGKTAQSTESAAFRQGKWKDHMASGSSTCIHHPVFRTV